jgi:hypothetical protein
MLAVYRLGSTSPRRASTSSAGGLSSAAVGGSIFGFFDLFAAATSGG